MAQSRELSPVIPKDKNYFSILYLSQASNDTFVLPKEHLTVDDCSVLIDFLNKNPQIKILKNAWGDHDHPLPLEGLLLLAANNRTLREINVGGSGYNDSHAEALANHEKLTSLTLFGCHLTNRGAIRLAATKLRLLNLNANSRIGTEGLEAIALNRTITKLYLHGMNMPENAARLFIANTSLLHFACADRTVPEQLRNRLAGMPLRNRINNAELERWFVMATATIILGSRKARNQNSYFAQLPFDVIMIILLNLSKSFPLLRTDESTKEMIGLVQSNIPDNKEKIKWNTSINKNNHAINIFKPKSKEYGSEIIDVKPMQLLGR